MTKIITIANRKGGTGKSMCAAHFALESIKSNKKTILIDLDPQKTLESWWEQRTSSNPYMIDIASKELIEKIQKIREQNFDFCIIDTPGDTSDIVLKTINISDIVIIPCKPTVSDLRAIGRTIEIVKKQAKHFIFIITQAIPRTSSSIQALSILSGFGLVAPNIIYNRLAYANAMSIGISATEIDKNTINEIEGNWNFIFQELNLITKSNENKKRKIHIK